jgi:large exoprotein involved in heme utilization and adhesion
VIEVGTLAMGRGAEITTGTSGPSPGGNVGIGVLGTMALHGRGSDGEPTGVYSDSEGAGAGGSIVISARDLHLKDGAVVSTESTGTGNAGDIFIDVADTVRQEGGSAITTAAAQADGGNIDVRTQRLLYLHDSAITATVAGGAGAGGNILIDPDFVVLNKSQIIANPFGGPGGNIRIVAGNFIASADSTVEASSELGIDGRVVIESSRPEISGKVVPLPESFLDLSGLLREHCGAERARGGTSSLVVARRGGVPVNPDGYLPSFAPVARDAEPVAGSRARFEQGIGAVWSGALVSCVR